MDSGRGSGERRASPSSVAAAVLLAIAAGAAAITWARGRFLRVAIEGESMLPTLAPGDWVIVDRGASRDYRPRPGHVVLANDPRVPLREIVKRVDHIDLHGAAWLLGDNPGESTDGRHFGALSPSMVAGRVRWRYWPPSRISRVR